MYFEELDDWYFDVVAVDVLPGDISLQKDVLDTIFPKILPLGTVMLCYWLMSKKKMAPTTVMLVLVGIALVGVLIGFFDPQLAY